MGKQSLYCSFQPQKNKQPETNGLDGPEIALLMTWLAINNIYPIGNAL
jgi:hypothetical protein